MMRSALAVVCGYLVFAVSAVALFQAAGRDPHTSAGAGFLAFSTLWGAGFGAAAGYVTAWIARRRPVLHAGMVAALLAGIAALSWAAMPAGGSSWTQMAAIFVFAPCAVAGGWARAKIQSK